MRRPPLLPLFALLVALLLPSAARAQDWEWAEGRVVESVLWEGLRRLNPAQALSMIVTRAGAPFRSQALSLDIARLYRSGRFGSPAPGVPPVAVVVREGEGAGVLVEFTVHERPPVRRVVFEGGGGVLDSTEVNKRLVTRAGTRYDAYAVEQDARVLREMLRDEGYLLAEVTHREERREAGVDVFFAINPGPEVYVDEIIYEGARELDPSVVEDAQEPDALETKERELWGLLEEGVYKPDAFRRDLDRIARFYRSMGYLDVRVYTLEERFSLDGEALTVVVAVEEGARYTVRRVGVEGARVIDGDRILESLQLKPGRPFLSADLSKSVEAIKHLYGQRAYVHAQVGIDVKYDLERHMLDVALKVDEGPKVRVEQIKIEGNEKTQENVVRRELSFYPGEYFNADEIQASIGRLGRLRYFKDVQVDFEPGTREGSEHLVLRVEEARTGSFVVGGGVSTAAGFFGNISLTQRNFDILDIPSSFRDFFEGHSLTGAGQSLSLSAQPGRERSQYSIEFVEPFLFDYPVPFSTQFSLRNRQREDWLETRRTGRFSLGYRLTQDLIFRTTYRIERVHVADFDIGAVPDAIEVAGTNYLSGLGVSLAYNQNLVDQDFVLYGGYAASIAYEVVGQFLGGDHDFHRVSLRANWQHAFFSWPAHHKWVLSLRTEWGWQRELFSNEPVPIFERFFAGGPASIRGFRFRSVGPKISNNPLGGNFLALATAEFSFPIFQDILRGVLFLDSGTVTPTHRDFSHSDDDLRVSVGFGFRLKVPVFPAPVALDFGWPLRKQTGDRRQVFSFSVGFGF